MAIRVKAGAIKQDTADASVFGYNTVYQSAAPEIAQALSQTANSVASASAKIKARKKENDLYTAQESYGEYKRALEEATSQLDTAYASQDEEQIKQAEANFSSFDAESEFFTVGTYGKEVDDPRVFRGFNERAKNDWAKHSLATSHLKEHRRSMGLLKDDHRKAEESNFKLINGLEGKRMTIPALRAQAEYLNQLYNQGYLNTLSSKEVRNAAIGNLNDKLEFLFESAARSGANDPEFVKEVKTLFTELRADGYFEGFARSEELVQNADKFIEASAEASAKEREEIEKERKKIEKDFIEKSTTRLFNNISQDNLSFELLRNEAEVFLKETNHIDIESLDIGSKERNELSSARAAAGFYSITDEEGRTPADRVLSSAFKQANETGTPVEDNIVIPPEYVKILERTRDFTSISANLRESAKFIHDQITSGNSPILNRFGIAGTSNHRQFLDRHGYEWISLFVDPSIPFEDTIAEPDKMEYWLDEVYNNNQSSPALMMEGHNLLTNEGSETDKFKGVVLQHVALAGDRQAAKTLSTLYARYYSLRNHSDTQTEYFNFIRDAVVREEGELFQLREQAEANSQFALAEVYDGLIDGMVVHMAQQEREDGGPLEGTIKRVVPFARRVFNTIDYKKLRREFNALEFQFVANNIGIARVSEGTGGHKVRVHQAFIPLLDLGEKDPFTFGDFVMSPLEGTLPYQKITNVAEAAFNQGAFTEIPDFFVRRLVEEYAGELVDEYELLFRPEILGTLGDDFRLIVDEYNKKSFPEDELPDRLLEATVDVAGRGTDVFKEVPLLDFSAFGKRVDNTGKPSGKDYSIGVAVRYYDRTSGRYRQLYDASGKPVVLDIQKVKDRIAPQGKLMLPISDYTDSTPFGAGMNAGVVSYPTTNN